MRSSQHTCILFAAEISCRFYKLYAARSHWRTLGSSTQKGVSQLFRLYFLHRWRRDTAQRREVFKPCRSRTTGYAAEAVESSGHDPKTVLVHLALAGCIVKSVGRSPSIRSSSLPVASVLGCLKSQGSVLRSVEANFAALTAPAAKRRGPPRRAFPTLPSE